MSNEAVETVVVRRHPGDWRTAVYRVSDVRGFRWDNVSGGVQRRTPRVLLFAYVDCTEAVNGAVAHSGMHRPCPHSIKVVIQQNDNGRALYRRLADLAGPKPAS